MSSPNCPRNIFIQYQESALLNIKLVLHPWFAVNHEYRKTDNLVYHFDYSLEDLNQTVNSNETQG